MAGKKLKQASALILSVIMIFLSFFTTGVYGAEKPDITAETAIIYCENTGETVYSSNRDRRKAPQSLSKLMTCLLAIQNLPLDKKIKISEEAVSQPGTSMGLEAGEQVTLKDLIYGAILCSGNDAAYAIAEAVSGNVKSFVDLMNKTAENIGCRNTRFRNPNGIERKGQYTTAYDMLQISRIALSNDIIREASETSTYTVEKTNKSKKRKLVNSMNIIRDEIPGIRAGKTGCGTFYHTGIAFKYEKAGLVLWGVLLNGTEETLVADIKTLTEYSASKIEGLKVVGKGVESGKVRIRHGALTSIPIVTEEVGYAYLPKQASDALISTKAAIKKDIVAPVHKGDIAGTYQIFVAGELVNEINLLATQDVQTGWFTSYIGISNRAAVIIGIVLALMVLFFIWIGILKAKYRREYRKKRKKKILEIAREEMRKEKEYENRGWKF